MSVKNKNTKAGKPESTSPTQEDPKGKKPAIDEGEGSTTATSQEETKPVKDNRSKGNFVTRENWTPKTSTNPLDAKLLRKYLVEGKNNKNEYEMREFLFGLHKDSEDAAAWMVVMSCNGLSNKNVMSNKIYGVDFKRDRAKIRSGEHPANVADIFRSICVDVANEFDDDSLAGEVFDLGYHRLNRWLACGDIDPKYFNDSAIFLITHGTPRESAKAMAVTKFKIQCLKKAFTDNKNYESLMEAVATQSRMNSLSKNAVPGYQDELTSAEASIKKLNVVAIGGTIEKGILDDREFNLGQQLLVKAKGKNRNEMLLIADEIIKDYDKKQEEGKPKTTDLSTLTKQMADMQEMMKSYAATLNK